MKKILNFLSRFALTILVVCYLIFAPAFILKNTLLKQDGLFLNKEISYYGVINMWHIESFEGGSASRTSWLLKRAQEFEKENKGSYISVTTMDQETAILNLRAGKRPQLISFSLGIGDSIKNLLLEYSGKKVGLEKLLVAAKSENKQLAVPYMLGGYCAFNNNKNNNTLISGLNDKSLTSLALSYYKKKNNVNINELSYGLNSFDAYASFIKGKETALFGTQRDFYRINNRINNNSIEAGKFEYCEFSDLVQYIGISKEVTKDEYEICSMFISYLLSEKSQNSLYNINMFSVLESFTTQTGTEFYNFEKYLKDNLLTINVFASETDLLNIRKSSIKFLKAEAKDLLTINKFII